MSNELINVVANDNGEPTVSGRELHMFLGVETPYTIWFPRMAEYGFTEGEDYVTNLLDRSDGKAGKPKTDHMMTVDMAKEICMLQRTERGKMARQYFIQIEKDWNSPMKIMARALKYASTELDKVKAINFKQAETIAVQTQQIAELQPKATYYDLILQCQNAIPITTIAKDYGLSAKALNKMLHDYGIQFKQGGKNGLWLLYQKYADKGYTSTRTQNFPDTKNGGMFASVHTYWTQKGRIFLYGVLKEHGVLPLMEKYDEEDEEEAVYCGTVRNTAANEYSDCITRYVGDGFKITKNYGAKEKAAQ